VSFEQIYASIWHHPILFWIVGFPFLLFLLTRARHATASPGGGRRLLWWLLSLFAVEILLDAWLTGKLSPIPSASGAAAATGALFVVLGDLRYFALLLRFGRDNAATARWLVAALALALVVPFASKVVAGSLWPGDMRRLFLCYELMFAALALAIRLAWLPRLPAGELRRWLTRLTHFEIAQYLGWATADLLILAGHDAGYLWRIVPNTMYYAAMLPFAWATAPARIRP
jgi:hypothetical protein